MNRFRLLGRASIAVGLSLVMLTFGTFISQARADCCPDGIPACSGYPKSSGCALGVCATGWLCADCPCGSNNVVNNCLCE